MTTTPPNGNGNGYTQKEMLARIDAKLDAVAAGLEAVKINFAVHEAKPHHEAAREEIDQLRTQVDLTAKKLAAYAGGIAVAAFVAQLLLRFFPS